MSELARQLLGAFEGFRMAPTNIDEYDSIGKAKLEVKFDDFISNNIPIKFFMLGYPFKSTNQRDKVLSPLPDLAEEVSLINFANFGNAVKKLYQPSIEIWLGSDGFAFNDLLGVSDNTVDAYAEVVKDMGRVAPVKWLNLRSFYPNATNVSSMREKLVEQFGISELELERRILTDPNVNALYKGMIIFMGEEEKWKGYPSRNQLQIRAKRVARAAMFRNEAYSQLVSSNFTNAIRLSMHATTNNGAKYSFQMIPGPRAWTSPWHCALAVHKDGYETIHKATAIERGYQLEYSSGRSYNFSTND